MRVWVLRALVVLNGRSGCGACGLGPGRICRDHLALHLDITTKTAKSTWLGGRCGHDTAILGLLRRERLAAEQHNDQFARAA